MRKFILAMVMAASIQGWNISMAQSNPPKVAAELPGSCLKWIHAAEPEFQRKHLDLDNYTISVLEQEESVTVILSSVDAPEGARGSVGKHPGYEVEISKKNMKILRSNYVR